MRMNVVLLTALLAAPLAANAQSTPTTADPAKAQRPGQPRLVPHVSFDGPALTFDFPGVKVGVAEYEEGPTGTTVLYFPTPVVAAVDVRGGAPGTLNTEALRLAYDDPAQGSMRSCSREARPTACLPPRESPMRSKT